MRTSAQRLVVTLLTLPIVLCRPALADETPSAADLVRTVIAAENGIHELNSLFLRIEGRRTATEQGIEFERAELQARYPQAEITAERFSQLRPETKQELELAFDAKRLRRLYQEHNVSFDLRVWDGKTATIHERYFGHEHYALDSAPQKYIGQTFFTGLAWPCVGSHSFWWNPVEPTPLLTQKPEDYDLTARTVHQGRRCYVLVNRRLRVRMLVDIEDQRLRRFTSLFVPTPSEEDPLRLLSNAAHRDFKSIDDATRYLAELSPTERDSLRQTHEDAIFERAKPLVECDFADYRSIAGFCFPMRHSLTHYRADNGRSFVDWRCEQRVAEIKVNDALPDHLFAIEMQDNIDVNDFRYAHDSERLVPFLYKSKKDRTKAEWDELLADYETRLRRVRDEQAVRDAQIGKPAVEFADSIWLNSSPLTWKDLQGKVVVLDFWATGCAPCRADMPKLNGLHDKRQATGVVVIGVHTAGGELEDIQAVVQQHKLNYPIYVDTRPQDGIEGFGAMSVAYGLRGIPYTVVVDREGKIAAHGPLDAELIRRARSLAGTLHGP